MILKLVFIIFNHLFLIMTYSLKARFLTLILLSFSTFTVLAQQAILPPDLDQYISEVQKTFSVPGLSIGVVKDGKIVLAKGYGIRKLGDPAPVDENTLFNIASNSKAFTATALAMLVEDGKIKWEDKVIDHLPWFKLSDDYVTAHLTIRDLFVHQSGIPAYVNDILLFPPSKFSRKELLLKLKDVKLKYDFRTVYAYDNILYLAAAEILEAKTNISWEQFVKERIFNKIGMDRSISKYSTLKNQSNVAYAHVLNNGKLEVLPSFFELNIGDASNPAGGIASSAKDMSKWLITQIDSGKSVNNNRIFSGSTTKELWKIVRPIPIDLEPEWLKPGQKKFSGYALGFRTYDYRGYQIVGHGGLLTGFVSQIAMVPDLKLGIVVLTNQLSTGAYMAIINHILDYNMKAEPFNWLAGYQKQWEKSRIKKDSTQKVRNAMLPNKNIPMSLPLDKYAGNYKDALIGPIVVVKNNSNLELKFLKTPHHDGKLTHFQGDIFKLVYNNADMGEGPFLSFSINPDQTIREGKLLANFSDADNDLENIIMQPDATSIFSKTELQDKINTELQKHKEGQFAIAVKDLSDSETFFINENKSFHAASTMKTPLMVELFKKIEQGKFALKDSIKIYNQFKSIVDGSKFTLDIADDSELSLYQMIGKNVSVEDLILKMITESSNLATNILIEKVGATNINKTLRTIGAKNINVLRGVEDNKAFDKGLNNTVTAYDLMLLFEKIASGEMVNTKASNAMIDILMQQKFRGIIPAKLPKEVKVANKTGSINKVLNDSGIVYLPNGKKYVIVLLSSGISNEAVAKNILATISKNVYQYILNKN
jgi:CubicO group peptidase (beta-lactamase class C family)/beta-lactamase class A